MTDSKRDTLALMLGLTVGTMLDRGCTPKEIADAFSRKNILAAAEIVKKKEKQ